MMSDEQKPEDAKPEKKKRKMDGGWGWIVVLGSALSHFLIVGMGRTFGVFYEELMEMYKGTAFETSMVIAIFNTMRMVMGECIFKIYVNLL